MTRSKSLKHLVAVLFAAFVGSANAAITLEVDNLVTDGPMSLIQTIAAR